MELPKIKISVWPVANENSKVRANVKLTIGDLISITPIRLIEGKKGFFLGMPQVLDREGEYRDVFYPVNREVRQQLTDMISSAYRVGKTMYKEFPSEVSLQTKTIARMYQDTSHELIGYASIVINDAFRMENIRLLQGAGKKRVVLFPERGFRKNGDVVFRNIFDFKDDYDVVLKKQISKAWDEVYEDMKQESIRVAFGQKEGKLSYDELMEIRLRREAERRREHVKEEVTEAQLPEETVEEEVAMIQ